MNENVALFDMDGTLCDYETALIRDLNKMRSPEEPEIKLVPGDRAPSWMHERMNAIRASQDWWEYLPELYLGMNVYRFAEAVGYRPMILTQGPKRNPEAWAGKKRWIDKNLGRDVDITITRDKGLVYGKVLVDDFPKYITRWLEWRPRGLVIMPASEHNKDFKHPQVIRYTACGNEDEHILDELEKRLGK